MTGVVHPSGPVLESQPKQRVAGRGDPLQDEDSVALLQESHRLGGEGRTPPDRDLPRGAVLPAALRVPLDARLPGTLLQEEFPAVVHLHPFSGSGVSLQGTVFAAGPLVQGCVPVAVELAVALGDGRVAAATAAASVIVVVCLVHVVDFGRKDGKYLGSPQELAALEAQVLCAAGHTAGTGSSRSDGRGPTARTDPRPNAARGLDAEPEGPPPVLGRRQEGGGGEGCGICGTVAAPCPERYPALPVAQPRIVA